MMPLSDATKAVVLEALEGQRALLKMLSDMGEDEHAGLTAIDAAITEVKAAGEWRPLTDENSIYVKTSQNPKVGLWVYADGERISASTHEYEVFVDLPDNIRLCEYIGSQEGRE